MPVVRRIGPLVAAVALGSSIAPASAGAQPAPGPPTSCEISRFGEPAGWSMSIVTAMDPGGRYIAGRGYPDDPWNDLNRFPVIWDRGVASPVPLPGVDQAVEDVNAAGVAVGVSYDPDTWEPLTPWVYAGGRLSPLPGVVSGDAVAINERGAVAGNRADGIPVWWPSANSDPEKLVVPDGATRVRTYDIDDDGTVVGVYVDRDNHDRGVVWLPDGTVKALPPLSGVGPGSTAFTIRNGWISGWAGSVTGTVAARWHLPTGAAVAFPQFWIAASDVNATGWLVGPSPSGSALFASDAGDLKLPGLVDHPDDAASRLSDDGRVIAGQARDKEGQLRAVRWDCE